MPEGEINTGPAASSICKCTRTRSTGRAFRMTAVKIPQAMPFRPQETWLSLGQGPELDGDGVGGRGYAALS